MDRIWKSVVIVAFLIIIDQLTKGYITDHFQLGESKAIIDGFFSFTYVQNKGMAWGMLNDAPDWIRFAFLKVLTGFVCLGIIYLWWSERKRNAWLFYAYTLVFAGAVGNLIDRVLLDYVVDFFDFYIGRSHFPAFNIADSCITIGGFMIGIDAIFLERKRAKKAEESAA